MDANPDDVLNTIRTMLRSNRVIMFGTQPSPEIAKAMGMEVVRLGDGWAWTIMNEKRPEYVPLSPGAYLASERRAMSRAQMVVTRNVYLRYLFRRERNRALAAREPSQKFGEGWYPWLRSTSSGPRVPLRTLSGTARA